MGGGDFSGLAPINGPAGLYPQRRGRFSLTHVLILFYISEMPKLSIYYDWNDPENSKLLDALANLRHLGVKNEERNPLTTRPGSGEALDAIMSCIDFWAERETGNRGFFWGKPPSVG
jgi:hypothetical protein